MEKTKEEKNRERALRAWETMRERGFHKYKNRPEQDFYDNPKKNKIRQRIANLIKKYSGGDRVLTLETNRFMLPNLLKKYNFFIAENDKEEYLEMIEKKPNNVFLHYGGIDEMKDLISDFHTIYLDFCCGYSSALPIINKLKDKFDKCNLAGFSFSLRRNNKEYLEDYTLDMIFKLQQFLGADFSPVYKISYAESGAMATVFFARANKISEKIEKSDEEYDKMRKEENKQWKKELTDNERIVTWSIKEIQRLYPHIWTPSQLFDGHAKTNYIKNDFAEVILKKVFLNGLKEQIIKYPWISMKRGYSENKDLDSIDAMFHHYIEVLFINIWEMWKDQDIDWQGWSLNWEHFVDNGFDLFLKPKRRKREKCFLCDNKEGIFNFKDKDFCVGCFIKQVTGQGFMGEKESPIEKYITNKYSSYSLKYSYGEYYNGDNICNHCGLKLLDGNKEQEIKIIEFNHKSYHPNCFNEGIGNKLAEVKELSQDIKEKTEEKILKVYNLKKKEEIK